MSTNKLKQILLERIEEIQKKPEASKVIFSAGTELVEDVKCSAKIRGFNFTIDEPKILGGGDTAPNPVEYVLAALGSCQEILYSAYSSVLGIPLESVKVDVKGTLDLKGLFGLDPEVKPGFGKVTYSTYLKSSAAETELKKLVDIVEKNCPVLDILSRPIPVEGNVKIVNIVSSSEKEKGRAVVV